MLKQIFLLLILAIISLSIQAQNAWPQKSEILYRGFSEVTSGEQLDYLQNLKPPNVALNLKAHQTNSFIAFRSEKIDLMKVDDTITLAWPMAYFVSDSLPACALKLQINEDDAFDFQPESLSKTKTLGNQKGQQLSFVFTHNGETGLEKFGYMFVHLPSFQIPKSGYIDIKISASSCQQGDWYMAFQDTVQNEQYVYPLPALLQADTGIVQPILIELVHADAPSEAEIWLGKTMLGKEPLSPGKSTFTYYIRQILSTKNDTILIRVKDQYQKRIPVTLEPVPQREVHFLPHSHVDVGFTHLQDEVELLQWKNLEEGIELAEKTKDYPEFARYKWNVEVLWAVDGYLKQATPAKRQKLIKAIQDGWIGLDATYATMLTGLQKPEELFQIFDYAKDLEDLTGIQIKSAMTTDVPGAQWGFVTALGENGIRYLNFGPNHMPHMPDWGYQVGHTIKTWGDIPHYWTSPDGNHKVLVWMSTHGYSWFHPWLLGSLEKYQGIPVLKFLAELNQKGYPYDIVQLRYTLGDNSGPDIRMPDFVKLWNEIYLTPKFVISTNQDMFEKFESKYADVLPVFTGDQSGYWEDGASSSALETAVNRNTSEKLTQVEQLWSMFNPAQYPTAEFKKAWRYLLLFSEHTWGAYSSKSDPDSKFSADQWKVKKSYGDEAHRMTDSLMRLILPVVTSDTKSIQIVNTLSWARSGIVQIPGDWTEFDFRITDKNSNNIKVQFLQNGELYLYMDNIPALSSISFQCEFIKRKSKRTFKQTKHPNKNIQFKWDTQTGQLISLRVPGLNFNLIDSLNTLGFNSYMYSGINNAHMSSARLKNMQLTDAGPLVWKWIINFDAPGSKHFHQEWTYIPQLERLEIVNVVDKVKVLQDENLRFAFPFHVPDATIRMDQQWGMMQPGRDQLPGSNFNFLSTQRWIDFSNENGGITWMSLDAPIVEFKDMHGQAWAADLKTRPWLTEFPHSTRLFSWVMNNVWFVNYKGYQDDLVRFRYVLLPHQKFDLLSTQQKSIAVHQPLLIGSQTISNSAHTFELNGNEAIMHTLFKPLQDGKGWTIRLWNSTDQTAQTKLTWKGSEKVKAFRSKGHHVPIPLNLNETIELEGFEVFTIELITQK